MTGKITVGTIQDTAGNTVASTYVTNGVAKAWVNYNQQTVSITVRDSLNQSSMTEVGTGYADTNWTNSFATVGYCNTASGRAEMQAINAGDRNTTSKTSYISFNGSASQIDADTNCVECTGDLA